MQTIASSTIADIMLYSPVACTAAKTTTIAKKSHCFAIFCRSTATLRSMCRLLAWDEADIIWAGPHAYL